MIKPAPESAAPPRNRILLGLVLMSIAMFIIPARDGLAKHMTTTLPVLTIAWGTYMASALVIVPVALSIHGRAAILPAGLYLQTARTLLLVSSMTIFFFSIRTVPLANATAAYFVAPFIVAALAPLVLGERLTWSIASAITFGFLGVILVLRPEGGFDINILWAVAAGLLFALYVLATRLAAQQAPPLAALSYQTLFGALILTPFAYGANIIDMSAFIGLFVLAGILQNTSHAFSIVAFRFAPAGVLAPLIYLEIVSAVNIGLVVFGDWPTLQTWAGIIVILVSGTLVAVWHK